MLEAITSISLPNSTILLYLENNDVESEDPFRVSLWLMNIDFRSKPRVGKESYVHVPRNQLHLHFRIVGFPLSGKILNSSRVG